MRFKPSAPVSGETVRVRVTAEDRDGDSLWFRYVWTLDGEPAGGNSAQLTLPAAAKGAKVQLSVTASDGQDESQAERTWADVANSPPRLVRLSITPSREIVAGADIVARPEAFDADGDPLSFRYEWTVGGRRVLEKGPVFSTRRLRRGNLVRVEVVASDGEHDSEALRSPELPIVNSPPRIVSQPGAASDSAGFSYRVRAEDPDGDTALQFFLERAPDGMKVDARGGTITWNPALGQAGSHPVSVVVDDLQGGRSRQDFEVVVNASESPSVPARRSR